MLVNSGRSRFLLYFYFYYYYYYYLFTEIPFFSQRYIYNYNKYKVCKLKAIIYSNKKFEHKGKEKKKKRKTVSKCYIQKRYKKGRYA